MVDLAMCQRFIRDVNSVHSQALESLRKAESPKRYATHIMAGCCNKHQLGVTRRTLKTNASPCNTRDNPMEDEQSMPVVYFIIAHSTVRNKNP